jgi:hypothetical protein
VAGRRRAAKLFNSHGGKLSEKGMALQVALSQLRHSKEASVKKSDENQPVSINFVAVLYYLPPFLLKVCFIWINYYFLQPESRKPDLHFETATSTASLFSVDETELFNFSDEVSQNIFIITRRLLWYPRKLWKVQSKKSN